MKTKTCLLWFFTIASLTKMHGMIDENFPHLENPFNTETKENNSNDLCGNPWDVGNFAVFTSNATHIFSRFHTEKITVYQGSTGAPEQIINDFNSQQPTQTSLKATDFAGAIQPSTGFGMVKENLFSKEGEEKISYNTKKEPSKKYVHALAISNKNTLAAGMTDGSIIGYEPCFDTLWGKWQYAKTFQLQGHQTPVFALAFHPFKNILVSGDSRANIKVWNIDTEECLISLFGFHKALISSIVYSNNGALAASASFDGTVIIWNTDNWQLLAEFKLDTAVSSMTFDTKDQYLFVGTWAGTIYKWNVEQGKTIQTFQAHNGCVSCMTCCTINNKPILFSCAKDGSLFVWDTQTGKMINGLKRMPQDIFFTQPTCSIAIHKNEWLICFCNNEEIYYLELESLLNPNKSLKHWLHLIKSTQKNKKHPV